MVRGSSPLYIRFSFYGERVFDRKSACMVWYGMVDVCDGYLAAEASGSSFG